MASSDPGLEWRDRAKAGAPRAVAMDPRWHVVPGIEAYPTAYAPDHLLIFGGDREATAELLDAAGGELGWEIDVEGLEGQPPTGTDAETEFKTGKAVFYQNGTWAYGSVKKDENGIGLTDDEFGMLPIYIGAKGEENQGLCTGSENYWCINAKASEADIKATLDFLYWVVTSEEGTTALADEMGFVSPFKAAKAASNPLVAISNEYIAEGKTSVSWNFSSIPSENWKNGVGTALTQYAAGTGSWDDVVSAFVNGWATEYKAANP